jgi:hypothetical protein
MAATVPSQRQQGITKALSGPNAVFKDKVRHFFDPINEMFITRFRRANQWNCGYPTWLLQKVSS